MSEFGLLLMLGTCGSHPRPNCATVGGIIKSNTDSLLRKREQASEGERHVLQSPGQAPPDPL